MPALNSVSFDNNYLSIDDFYIDVETETRTFGEKGLFIVPYDTSRILAAMDVTFKVIDVSNEYQTLWSNPEIGFYGYVHARKEKVPIGAAIALNQRKQEIFHWSDPQQHTQIEIIGTLISLGQFLGSTIQIGRIFFPSPTVTDFSFGFPVEGRYEVTIKLSYWKEQRWPDANIPRPYQTLPDPEDVKNIDPGPGRELGDPETPISPPYTETGEDFGESTPGTPPPQPELPVPPFRFVYNASGPGFNSVGAFTAPYNGPQPTGYSTTPVLVPDGGRGRWVVVVTNPQGTVNVDIRAGFVTQEQNDAFLATFTIVGTAPA